jgi:hypothetical protein
MPIAGAKAERGSTYYGQSTMYTSFRGTENCSVDSEADRNSSDTTGTKVRCLHSTFPSPYHEVKSTVGGYELNL